MKGEYRRFVNGHHGRGKKRPPEVVAKMRAARLGVPKTPEQRANMSGERHPRWKGGRYVDAEGYVRVLAPGTVAAYGDGYALEHRVVMAAALGRELRPDEHVHHVNEVKTDNRLENLRLMSRSAHIALHKRKPKADRAA